MGRRFRLPMFAVAAAMLGLIAVLATLQYKWLGQISAAERERMRATLNTRATGFAHDVDRELTRAYLLFQVDAAGEPGDAAARVSARYDRWHATARFPRMIGGIYLVTAEAERTLAIKRFDPSTRQVEPAEWPDTLRALHEEVAQQHLVHSPDGLPVRAIPSILVDSVPAIVVPTPIIVLDPRGPGGVTFVPRLSFTILVLDREYLAKEMLPALADQHFRGAGEGFDYRLAVVRPADNELVYHSARDFTPAPGAQADAAVDLFAVRLQDFSALAAEVRRFATFVGSPSREGGSATRGSRATTVHRQAIAVGPGEPSYRLTVGDGPKMSIVVQQGGPGQKAAFTTGFAAAGARAGSGPRWKLLVKHPAGSLEAAVQVARRRNVLISSGILALLGASMGLLVLSTRRAQRLAAQQMEFVAAVSHELRTPLAVIRSAGENLADGVVASHEQIRKYGDLVRNEGRRLTEMVEQILEFAGIQSGQHGFALRPVAVRPLLDDIVESSRALVDGAGLKVDIDVPEALPPVLGDEEALRRVFQNLFANAIKYGANGGWIGVRAQGAGREVRITVSDRGIGIAPAEHAKIFEPFYRTSDVIAAQIHGAGLGLSLVKRIVEAHGGRITVRSAPGQGSEFTVQLPAAGEQPLAAPGGERREPAARAAGLQS